MAEAVREDTLVDAEAAYRKKGFTGRFGAAADAMVHCYGCGEHEPAEQVPLKGLHRFEGASDPGEEMALAAVECPACGAWGTLVLAYGPEAGPEDNAVLAALMDDRSHSPIRPGE